MPIPEESLVYSHCSSIFTGTNAEVRRLKNVRKILVEHKASIRGFIDEFGLDNVSAVAKKLLKEGLFETPRRARRRFPALFEKPEAEGDGGTAPEAELLSFETAAAREALGTSEEEDHAYLPINWHNKQNASLRTTTPEGVSPHSRSSSTERSDPYPLIHGTPSALLWSLHPIYLPFRIQHKILTFVQSTLEERCLEFGQTWAPRLMKAHDWDEPESIELTEWIKQFSKFTKDLPPSATRPIAGKSLNQVLFDATRLRHTAVHRIPTDVKRIVGMLHSAHDFALALKDTARAALIKRIEEQLAASTNILVQGPDLLQHKTSGQLQVTAKGRTELVKLEKLCITNVRTYESGQRTEAASAIKDAISDPQHDSSPRSSNHAGKNTSPVSEQATPENVTLKTEPQSTIIPGHELPIYHNPSSLLSAELFTPVFSFISKTGTAMLGHGAGVFGWERKGREDGEANGKEQDFLEDFFGFL